MAACSALGKAVIEVGTLVNIWWQGVPKNAGPRDRSKWKTATLVGQDSAWEVQKRYFRPKNLSFWAIFGNFPLFGGSPWGAPQPPIGPFGPPYGMDLQLESISHTLPSTCLLYTSRAHET